MKDSSPWSEVLSGAVIVSALGYFVDIYDLFGDTFTRDSAFLGCNRRSKCRAGGDVKLRRNISWGSCERLVVPATKVSENCCACFHGVFSDLCRCIYPGKRIKSTVIYSICFLMGFGMGYWAVFMMIASELFGTNLRANVTTSVPNFVRGSVVPMTLLFTYLKTDFGIVGAAQIVGLLAFSGAFWAVLTIRETYGRDLEFVETPP